MSLSACSSRPAPAVHTTTPGPGVSQSVPAATPTRPTPDPSAPTDTAVLVHVEVTGTPQAPTLTVTPTPPDAATSTSDGDSGLLVTAPLPDADGTLAMRLRVAAPTASTVAVAPDDTAAVLSPSGDLVVGLAAPGVVDATGTPLAASWRGPDPASTAIDGLLAVDLVLDDVAAPAAFPLDLTVHLGTTVVAAVEWGTREGGESLAVTPSAWGRVSGQTGYGLGWADVLRMEPAADTAVLEKQFRCHQLGAPDKATWNLEPWRPDVSYLAYVAARCNPV